MASGFNNSRDVDVNNLSMTDIENSQKAFSALDLDNQGVIEKDDLKTALEIMGISCEREDIVKLLHEIERRDLNSIEYNEFLKMIAYFRSFQSHNDENDFVDAFVAMGGNPDQSGKVDAQKLIEVIKEEFSMTIDIVKLIQDIDEDGSGEIEYDEFRALLSNTTVGSKN